jgi:hypothetical protein
MVSADLGGQFCIALAFGGEGILEKLLDGGHTPHPHFFGAS